MLKKREIPRPTEGELELLEILWERGPATVRELFDEVNVKRPVVYTGVLKLLQIMTEKGSSSATNASAPTSIAPPSPRQIPNTASCAS